MVQSAKSSVKYDVHWEAKNCTILFFCNNLVKSFYIAIIIGIPYIYPKNWERNYIKIIYLISRLSIYCLVKSTIRIRTALSRKLKLKSHLKHLNETSYKV